MPYVIRTVVAGDVIEVKKMFTGRLHPINAVRGKNCGKTPENQEKANERKAEERLRWKLNANFTKNDLHAVLHYNDKAQGLEKIEEDLRKFLRNLRAICKKNGIALKYIACTETKRMTNPHHHVILPEMDPKLIVEAWDRAGGNGRVSFKLLDSRGNHEKLAAYLIKETRSTQKRHAERKGKKRFSCSQGLIMPEPEYRTIGATSWRKEPAPIKGYRLYKDEEGVTVRTGFHEISGYAWQEYFMVRNI